jgi:hypothetical protein
VDATASTRMHTEPNGLAPRAGDPRESFSRLALIGGFDLAPVRPIDRKNDNPQQERRYEPAAWAHIGQTRTAFLSRAGTEEPLLDGGNGVMLVNNGPGTSHLFQPGGKPEIEGAR